MKNHIARRYKLCFFIGQFEFGIIFLDKTLCRRPALVKDNDWIIFLEYDALYIFFIPYPNQESLTNSPEVFPFSSRVFPQFAFAKPKKLWARVEGGRRLSNGALHRDLAT